MDKKKRITELVEVLNRARKAYYAEDREIMSNLEYDQLLDELSTLEQETGIVLSSSPTLAVGYEAVDELPKEAHEAPMLSLDKTKDEAAFKRFIGMHKSLLSWKLDGLTIVLTYRGGQLFKAVTRGNGLIGEVVTPNARVFENIPLHIAYTGELILRGEAVIRYPDFERINTEIEDVDAKYKNPRNLCSGSVRQLDSKVTAGRHVHFYAFALVSAPGVDFANSRQKQMKWLDAQGFEVVGYRMVDAENFDTVFDWFRGEVPENDFPSDGLVALYDDIAYGDLLGTTAKFPRNAYAFKWADETRTTVLREVEWSPSRTGLLNPVAIFDPVELEGTTVRRASLHNLSIIEELKLGIGDELLVYKANMIIPQIAENLTGSGQLRPADVCPACGEPTVVEDMEGVKTLHCPNPECPAKQLKAFALFVSRDAMNIDGLSEATLTKLIGRGFIREYADIYNLDRHADEIRGMEGFGELSCKKLMEAIAHARTTTVPRLVYALGIPNIGLSNAKMISRTFGNDLDAIIHADEEALDAVDGVGAVIAKSFADYFADERNLRQLRNLRAYLTFESEAGEISRAFAGKTFVITGSVTRFANRSELKAYIETRGGKVTGSVTSHTDYLINNDTASASSKNKKAKEFGIPILSEEEFLGME